MDHANGLGRVSFRLQMKRHQIGAALFQVCNVLLRLTYHNMHIKKQTAYRTNALDDRHTEGNIRHKMSVHHINVQPVGAALFRAVQFLFQAGKVRRKH